jgi:hypothetical protein
MPSAGVRFAAEAAFLVLVAMGLGLARFDPIVIAVVMFVAWVLVAILERASAREAARAREAASEEFPMPPPHVERIEVEPAAAEPEARAAEPEPEPEPAADAEPEPEPTVGERSARAILASGPPPLPAEPPQEKPARRAIRRPVTRKAAPAPPPPPAPEPEAEPVPVASVPAREWNLWELQRAVRDADDDLRHEEWSALLMYLREFANADGDLPIEFDALVRESFGPLLDTEEREAAAAT